MSRLVFDIGGTNLRMALAGSGELGEVRKMVTPRDPTEAVEAMRAFLVEQEAWPQDIVGGVAGMVRNGAVESAPNLLEWEGFDLGRALGEALHAPVTIYNDADIAGLGEAVRGAGRGYRYVAYLTVGTGVGGTLVMDGKIAPHADGLEPGKQIIEYGTGRTLESLIGGAALRKETGQPSDTLPHTFFQSRTKALATGIYNAVRHWSPDIFILNGPLVNEENGFHLGEVAAELAKIDAPELPSLVRAGLGDLSGLYGAALVGT